MESITPEIVTDQKQLKSTEELIKNLELKIERAKNEVSERLLDSIKSHQEVTPELTKANVALFRRINKILDDDTVELNLDVLAFLTKALSEFTTKHMASAISAFKNDGQQSAAKKSEMPKPGMNSLALPNGKEVTKEEIQAGKQLQSQIENINQLRKALPEST